MQARGKTIHNEAYRSFLRNLAEARKLAKLTQLELAERLGKPQSHVSKVESGERRLDVLEFVLWARALGVNPVEVLSPLLSSEKRRRVQLIKTPEPDQK